MFRHPSTITSIFPSVTTYSIVKLPIIDEKIFETLHPDPTICIISSNLSLNKKCVKRIIGLHGGSIQKIRHETGAKITIRRQKVHTFRTCFIEGIPLQVAHAEILIQSVIDQITKESIKTPPYSVNLLIAEQSDRASSKKKHKNKSKKDKMELEEIRVWGMTPARIEP